MLHAIDDCRIGRMQRNALKMVNLLDRLVTDDGSYGKVEKGNCGKVKRLQTCPLLSATNETRTRTPSRTGKLKRR